VNAYRKYFTKKAFWYLLTLCIALVLNFALPRLIEGNPVDMIVNKLAKGMTNTDQIKHIYDHFYREFGLNQPMWKQFIIYMTGIVKGDMGTSFTMYPRKINDIIGAAVPWTLALQFPAIIIGWLVGNVLGAYSAYKKGIFDKIIFPITLFISSIPFFILSIIILYIFGLELEWFPAGGGYSYTLQPGFSFEFIMSAIRHHTLPFLSIVFVMIGGQGIGMREMALYELSADYVKYSKFMGIRESKIIRYVFRNAMLPQITGLALSLGTMIAGGLITEIVFNYPGLGTVLFRAIRSLDYPLISGCTLVITLTVLASNFLVDIVYGLIDPRIKAAQIEES